jgi:hypothetical protein
MPHIFQQLACSRAQISHISELGNVPVHRSGVTPDIGIDAAQGMKQLLSTGLYLFPLQRAEALLRFVEDWRTVG